MKRINSRYKQNFDQIGLDKHAEPEHIENIKTHKNTAYILPWQGDPSLRDLANYATMVPGQVELTRSSLYDTLAYAQAGQSQLQFFQTPKGQGGKTYADSNMSTAGSLPQPQSFLIQTIELWFFPGSAVLPAAYGAGAVSAFTNDTYKVFKYGSWLELYIGSKPYLDEAPLLKFPPRNGLTGFAAMSDSTTAGATQANQVAYASAGGPTYELNPPILLTPNTNFNVTLNWPTVQAISAAGTMMCSMSGWLYRLSQ